ncbi:hypothetical protein QL285_096075 [Trifolium repens]|nr:hypothetical protein QL285_096075 [Trifolium repens]
MDSIARKSKLQCKVQLPNKIVGGGVHHQGWGSKTQYLDVVITSNEDVVLLVAVTAQNGSSRSADVILMQLCACLGATTSEGLSQ